MRTTLERLDLPDVRLGDLLQPELARLPQPVRFARALFCIASMLPGHKRDVSPNSEKKNI